jgi:hypothetical protein
LQFLKRDRILNIHNNILNKSAVLKMVRFFSLSLSQLGKKVICFCIFSEFILAGLGFCGHQHDHGSDFDVFSQKAAFSSADHVSLYIHIHTENSDRCKGITESAGKIHCSCLGGFLASPPFVPDRIILELQAIFHNPDHQYHYRYSASLFHPPLFHS